MHKKVILASDSTCDLNQEMIEKYHIKILPLGVSLGEKQYLDGIDIDSEYIYSYYEKTGVLPKTSAVNVADFDAFFKKHTSVDCAIVVFTISSEMSSTYNNARIAAANYKDVYVVDTKSLSTGGGMLVVTAGEMILEGKSAKEIAERCSFLADCVDASFVIDDLEFLHKGGRCSAIAEFGANLLQLKPCVSLKNGKLVVTKKYRGNFMTVIEKYIDDQLSEQSDIDTERIFITHAGCSDQVCQNCLELIKKKHLFKEISFSRTGCTISSHCGRNTLGIALIRKNFNGV